MARPPQAPSWPRMAISPFRPHRFPVCFWLITPLECRIQEWPQHPASFSAPEKTSSWTVAPRWSSESLPEASKRLRKPNSKHCPLTRKGRSLPPALCACAYQNLNAGAPAKAYTPQSHAIPAATRLRCPQRSPAGAAKLAPSALHSCRSRECETDAPGRSQ
jgi:hypothetical protein